MKKSRYCSLTNCQGRFTTYPGDPFYQEKLWLYWHSPIGIDPARFDEEKAEKARQEAEEFWSNAPLMLRFTEKVLDALCVAIRKEANKTTGHKSKEYWRLSDAIMKYEERNRRYRSQYLDSM